MKLASVVLVLACACGTSDKAAEEEGPPLRPNMELARKRAEAEAALAMKDAQEAIEKVVRLQKDLEDLSARTTAAVDMVVAAQNDADRAAAKAKLQALQKEQAEMQARIAEARASAERARRQKGVKISKECIDNPLAKGCE